MHSNVHFAMGVVIGSASLYFFPTNTYMDLIYLIIIILVAIMADLDVFVAKYAQDGDHRNFFTHSIYIKLISCSLWILRSEKTGILFAPKCVWLLFFLLRKVFYYFSAICSIQISHTSQKCQL